MGNKMAEHISIENRLTVMPRESRKKCQDDWSNVSTGKIPSLKYESFESFIESTPWFERIRLMHQKFKSGTDSCHHSQNITSMCQQCEYESRHKFGINRRMNDADLKIKNVRSLKKFVCDQCSFSSTKKKNVSIHHGLIHVKKEKHECKYKCGYESPHKSDLNKHINDVHHTCQICNYTSLNRYKLGIHVREVHMKLKTYQCRFCDHSFARRTNLNNHVNAVHLQIKNYVCRYCPIAFSRKAKLVDHENAIHLKIKKFACNECPNSFFTKQNLVRHKMNNNCSERKDVNKSATNQHTSITQHSYAIKPET